MKLCMINDGAAYKLEEGMYHTRDAFLLYSNELSKYFSKVHCIVPIYPYSNSKAAFVWRPAENIEVVESYPYLTVEEYYRTMLRSLIKNGPTLANYIKASDIVFLRLPSMNAYLGYLFARLYKKAFLCYVIGDQREIVRTSSKYQGLRRALAIRVAWFHKLLTRRIIRHSGLNIFMGNDIAQDYGQTISPEGKNHISFTSLVAPEDIVVKEPSLDGRVVKILSVGRLGHEKGFLYLIEAVSGLLKEGLEVELQIVGEGDERESLQRLVNRMGLESKVFFSGSVSHGEKLDDFFLEADVFVLPSLSEGVPKVVLEAMSKGVPVVATQVGGVPDIVKDRETGLLIPPKSSDAITHAVSALVLDEVLRKQIVESAHVFIREHTLEKQVRKLADLIYANCKNLPV